MLSDMFGYLVDYIDDIDSDRALGNAAAAAGALRHAEVLVEILELVAHALAEPGTQVLARVVAGSVHGEIGELAIVPGAHPVASQRRGAGVLVVDVETVAGRAQERAGAATDAGTCQFFPQRRVEARLEFGR